MRSFVFALLFVVGSMAQAQCPNCGGPQIVVYQVTPTNYQQPQVVATQYAQAPQYAAQSNRANVRNVVGMLNQQRSRRRRLPLGFDPTLQAVAERRAQTMANSRIKDHPPGSYSPGRAEGVGWSSSRNPSQVSACYTNSRQFTACGAAAAEGPDGTYFAVVYR